MREKGVHLDVRVEFDASASLFQIVSALMKNRLGAEKSNLIPARKSPKDSKLIMLLDVYQDLLNVFKKDPNSLSSAVLKYMKTTLFKSDKLDIDWHPKDLDFDSSPKLKNFMLNLIRKVLKTTLMTKFYGKGSKALTEDFVEAFIQLEQQNKL